MKDLLKYGLVLLIVASISCGVLAFVNSITAPLIEENKRQARINAQRTVFPEARDFIEVDNVSMTFYVALDSENELLGYVLETVGIGYNGNIRAMVGINQDLSIKRVAILEHEETPGLGDKITRNDFLNLFMNLEKHDLRIDREGGRITNITGATISTRTLTNSIREHIELLESRYINELENHDWLTPILQRLQVEEDIFDESAEIDDEDDVEDIEIDEEQLTEDIEVVIDIIEIENIFLTTEEDISSIDTVSEPVEEPENNENDELESPEEEDTESQDEEDADEKDDE
ncbi:MAG: RnfABCDGE type electron transport complex subunit G [Candidatus Cloacimonetes bacterium]|nr:RnfABCDGE type electron transport complex subunit G [Candidatus Cloacimonadota bacterium]